MTTTKNTCTKTDIKLTIHITDTDDRTDENEHSDYCSDDGDGHDRYNECYGDWGDGDQYHHEYDYDNDGYYGDMTDKYRYGPEFQRKDVDVIIRRFKERRTEERNTYKVFNLTGILPELSIIYYKEYDKIALSTTHKELSSILQGLDRIIRKT